MYKQTVQQLEQDLVRIASVLHGVAHLLCASQGMQQQNAYYESESAVPSL